MNYNIKEIYYTIQGEGYHTGQSAVFCRFTGCNLWSGREEDRNDAICSFCDTDFLGMDGDGGGKYTANELVDKITSLWPESNSLPIWCVFTGGEPLLQLDDNLINRCHKNNIYIAVETNGTIKAPKDIDWLCVSPKSDSNLIQKFGDELKLVVPQENQHPSEFQNLKFNHFSLQPLDGPNQNSNIKWATHYCLKNPQWRLSLQMHKLIGLR